MFKVPRKLPISAISTFSTTGSISAQQQPRVFPLQHLNENEKKLVEKVKNFAQSSVKPLVREMDRDARINKQLLKKAFDLKLMGLKIDPKYGGSGVSFFELVLAVEELSKIDPAIALIMHLQNALVAPLIEEFGNEELKEKYLKKLCKDSVGAFALSEVVSGSDAFAMQTVAKKDGDHFILNGSKWGISNAPIADFFLVLANADPEKGYRGVTCFIVDRDHEGVVLGEQDDNLGMRAGTIAQVHLNSVRVPKTSIVGEYGKGYKYAIEVLNASRIVIGAQMGLQHQIAKIQTEIEAARLMVYNCARMKDCGMPFVKEASMAKYYAPEVACKTTKQCIEWLGGVGFTKNFMAEKFYRDAVVGGIYEGTSNIQLNTIAKFIDNEFKHRI
ncbi:Short/branched chain specific acyl-CoA dehydrogenase, mitochondrial [Caenorhabditis elegans]|uniref:Short/branched chain specific acyl-CoA dehydrogenase, mitochondrial n=1 Tax=Caenorhabditis elegans TaxID=6239 RepID=H2KYU0_CAEEL|nr:Short/branched chain specific acyl-CoA dehydrogenase, mitochondrial [Caenorhabditis elegans]CCD64845.2 Short/branched chain specific acyl-CoA dehydrogenase, mitochondrial [Caenorhabditis elegans]|eukprot:NP_001343623.1 Acyl CoA DeHydrogenase [Caenorhabditis elegans]